ncbi:hypothetical protein PAAG_03800 [Paracoccidioides lutzii Pb01]|uniref:Uncharacterized protein n=1 Tax=Paracoccidioides lutzii (strain ATCC MYA-826 / Pb01) TaxID=502779 RepID=C1GZ56_PARBA|nr:hypothetical protein PAAG_03800 [Paracoccidioides lutzii Pb01]EEH41879.2 hypothetical protein PAAG_03800 [Paracoccidioides lutzii Pb01]
MTHSIMSSSRAPGHNQYSGLHQKSELLDETSNLFVHQQYTQDNLCVIGETPYNRQVLADMPRRARSMAPDVDTGFQSAKHAFEFLEESWRFSYGAYELLLQDAIRGLSDAGKRRELGWSWAVFELDCVLGGMGAHNSVIGSWGKGEAVFYNMDTLMDDNGSICLNGSGRKNGSNIDDWMYRGIRTHPASEAENMRVVIIRVDMQTDKRTTAGQTDSAAISNSKPGKSGGYGMFIGTSFRMVREYPVQQQMGIDAVLNGKKKNGFAGTVF